MPLKLVYRALRKISDGALWAFYSEVHVDGDVPKDGPLLIASCHHNEIIDIATLSATIPHRRMLNYWTKDSLFANPIARVILTSSGTIPVSRVSKSKDEARRIYQSTSETLGAGGTVGVFPEGTSYTEPRIVQVKDGVARAALEYVTWEGPKGARAVKKRNKGTLSFVPVAIVYTDKSRYQSRVHVKYGSPILMDSFITGFLSSEDDDARTAVVRRLTNHVASHLVQMTINAPDWDTLYAARIARDILWTEDKHIPLADFVDISQTLIDTFSDPEPSPALVNLKNTLLRYFSLLYYSRLRHSSLSSVPIHADLRTTCASLLSLSTSLLLRAPFILPPLILHIPIYIISTLAAKLAKDEEEARAQFKVIFGMLGMSVLYPASGWTVWQMVRATDFVREASVKSGSPRMVSLLVMFSAGWALAQWHNVVIAGSYRLFHRFRATVYVFLGLFAKSAAVPDTDIKPYTILPPPVFNPFIKRTSPTPAPSSPAHVPKRIPTRRLVPHVLSARADAIQSLHTYLRGLHGQVRASEHLARRYRVSEQENGTSGKIVGNGTACKENEVAVESLVYPNSWRDAGEVIDFLRERNAKL